MPITLTDSQLERAANAKSVAVLTGAGVSAESGVPTFRGKEGLWRTYRAEELATPEAFHRDPKLVWEWYDWRRGLVATKKPNPSHDALVEMEQLFDTFALITQNVDGLHRLAGSSDPVEMHGNIWFTRCTGCWVVTENRTTPLPTIPPLCDLCGAMLRPHIVWFGESLDEDVLSRTFAAANSADLFIVAGTSGVVQPAASLADMARQQGALVIEINIENTPLSGSVDATLLGGSGELLPQLIEELRRRMS